MMWFDGGWGWGSWFMMTLLMVVFWGLVIAAVAAVVHYVRGAPRDGRPGPSGQQAWGWGQGHAEDLLAERFARGEIDEDEYKRRLTLLREHR
ncbi:MULTISPECIES: SHOCT domain-containing protein [Streptomyces]|uniref:SHOCT domain-containing protein n=1 Tax=Streptomyces TaxID=1883 RepID=UPI003442D094